MRPPLPCMCGHREVAHEHHRAGLDCSVTGCSCLDYRPATRLRKWWYAHFVTKPLSMCTLDSVRGVGYDCLRRSRRGENVRYLGD